MDHKKYAKKFTDKWGTEYELLSEYEGSSNKIKMRQQPDHPGQWRGGGHPTACSVRGNH